MNKLAASSSVGHFVSRESDKTVQGQKSHYKVGRYLSFVCHGRFALRSVRALGM